MHLIRALPEGLATWIEHNARSATEKNYLTRLSSYLIGKHQHNGVPYDEPLDVSQVHFREQVGTGYNPYLRKLEAGGVLHVDHEYIPGRRDPATGQRLTLGQCKRYQFDPQYIESDPELVEFTDNRRKQFDRDQITRQTVNVLSRIRLTLREPELKQYVAELVTVDHIRAKCKVNEEIPAGGYEIRTPVQITRKDGQTSYSSRKVLGYRSRAAVLELAKAAGVDAILYQDKLFLADLSDFLEQRRYNRQLVYLNSLVKLKHIRKRQNIECKRNDTNRRLDTNLTNLKSDLLQYVTLDGEHLVSLDLVNSQPRLLAWLMEAATDRENILENSRNQLFFAGREFSEYTHRQVHIHKGSYKQGIESTSPLNVTKILRKGALLAHAKDLKSNSYALFQKLTKTGQFYDDFADRYGNGFTRDDAKKSTFVTLFASDRHNDDQKRAMGKTFPEVVAFADGFKSNWRNYLMSIGVHEDDAKPLGKSSLAVLLQTIEARIFIDCILARLLAEGYRVLSKHDSILCKESDRRAVEAIVKEELDGVFGAGQYRLKTEFLNPNRPQTNEPQQHEHNREPSQDGPRPGPRFDGLDRRELARSAKLFSDGPGPSRKGPARPANDLGDQAQECGRRRPPAGNPGADRPPDQGRIEGEPGRHQNTVNALPDQGRLSRVAPAAIRANDIRGRANILGPSARHRRPGDRPV